MCFGFTFGHVEDARHGARARAAARRVGARAQARARRVAPEHREGRPRAAPHRRRHVLRKPRR